MGFCKPSISGPAGFNTIPARPAAREVEAHLRPWRERAVQLELEPYAATPAADKGRDCDELTRLDEPLVVRRRMGSIAVPRMKRARSESTNA
ncbi:hypothetical protein OH76DRAFT_1117818 [Lentinus brumalis]|uniref:Uncharacterized protein n=1 Tax=Lentinus brumalis TaxID=2498619 RepID=A0A371CUW9_9APHY|nr:hypothetical protein OH76DRAFT_1117818 [Polyporus brumalis]